MIHPKMSFVKTGFTFSFLVIILTSANLNAQNFSPKNIKKHVAFLASDKLHGRGSGTKDEAVAAEYIIEQFKQIGLTPQGDDKTWLNHFTFKQSNNPHEIAEANAATLNCANVVGYLDNGAEFTIAIGAHYDHLGNIDGEGSSLEANPEKKIHNGADDNASGVAGVIELARYFKNNGKKEPFNFLFLCFSGEELGLIGSKRFCENPTYPIEKLSYYLNMDMIGRYREEKGLVIQGVGTSELLPKIIEYTPTKIKIALDSSGTGPSDYTSFYLKRVPVLGFFSGAHSDYHKSTDDVGKINFEGEITILNYITQIIEGTCTFDKQIFKETASPQSQARSFKVTLGVIPDYSFDKKGLRLDGVSENRPASKAGLKAGDIIIKIGEYNIENIYTYMDVLEKFNKTDKTTLILLRDGKEMSVEIEF